MYGLALFAASTTRSVVLAILGGSFCSVAKAGLALAPAFILSACGGSAKEKQIPTRTVHGPGFAFTVPASWSTSHTPSAVVARSGDSGVSATVFNLVKPYDPTRFEAAARELDGV